MKFKELKKVWIKLGALFFVGSIIILPIVNYFDNWGKLRCGWESAYVCNFFQFIIDPINFLLPVILLTVVGFIFGKIIDLILKKINK